MVQMWRRLASIIDHDFSLEERFFKKGLRLSPKRRRRDCRNLVYKSSPTDSLQPQSADVVGPHTKGKTNEQPHGQRELSPEGMNSVAPTQSAVSASLQTEELREVTQEQEQDEAKKTNQLCIVKLLPSPEKRSQALQKITRICPPVQTECKTRELAAHIREIQKKVGMGKRPSRSPGFHRKKNFCMATGLMDWIALRTAVSADRQRKRRQSSFEGMCRRQSPVSDPWSLLRTRIPPSLL